MQLLGTVRVSNNSPPPPPAFRGWGGGGDHQQDGLNFKRTKNRAQRKGKPSSGFPPEMGSLLAQGWAHLGL